MFDAETRIDSANTLPRHIQVQHILRDMVSSGRLKPGDKIPAEIQIADALGVSKMTVNKALLALTADGVFVREVGRGTFVALPGRGTDALPGESGPRTQRVVLSFVEGARNVLDSDYYGALYSGLADALETPRSGKPIEFSLATLSTSDYLREGERAPADGRVIIAPRRESMATIQELWGRGKPLMILGATWPTIGLPSVDADNVGGAREAVCHLLGLGHRRIALLYAEEETANTQDRIVGYRRALSEAGLGANLELEVCASEAWRTGESSRHKMALLLGGSEPVTAIFAAGYYLALEAMNIVREAGLGVPEDVSIVGFDDPLSARLVFPALTTVRQPLYAMGRRAAERLLQMLDGQDGRDGRSTIRELLPAELVMRNSTALLRSRRKEAALAS